MAKVNRADFLKGLFGLALLGAGSLLSLTLSATPLAAASASPCRVVLIRGAFGSTSGSAWFLSEADYFKEWETYFSSLGAEVEILSPPPDGSLESRLKYLELGMRDKHVTLAVGHSLGGLDLRVLGTRPTKGVKMDRWVSISAPQNGSELAVQVLNDIERGGFLLSLIRMIVRYDPSTLDSLNQIVPAAVEKIASVSKPKDGSVASARIWCKSGCSFPFRLLGLFYDLPEGDGLIGLKEQAIGEDLGLFDLDHRSVVDVDPRAKSERDRLMRRVAEFGGLDPSRCQKR